MFRVIAAIFFVSVVFSHHVTSSLKADTTKSSPSFLAGAAIVDISPRRLPVIQNGGFMSKVADRVAAPLYARSLVVNNANESMAIVIVDSCMIPRDVSDLIKEEASSKTGISTDRILIAATHTHSAPSVMDYCLGTMQDREYTVQMIPQVVQSITEAFDNLEPAMAGWAVVNAWDFTNSRRWIKRSDRIDLDPFGDRTVRAMMHPNPLSDYVGPSGPEDPALTVLSIVRPNRTPLATLANFSMHYHGSGDGIHPDYFGIYAKELEAATAKLSSEQPFIGIMSQGTSGDLHLRTYDVDRGPEPKPDVVGYAKALVELTLKAISGISYHASVPIAMAQRELTLKRRLPDAERLTWAKDLNAKRGDSLPKTRPEVYAMQAEWIHEHPESKLILQAARIGELGITAIPNEVYGITGLKIKAHSPLALTMNLELANGADGYIPPPEQHFLGGYTTWPSRTAGLEAEAEPKIVEAVVSLLEEVSHLPRVAIAETNAMAAEHVLALKPKAYWRMDEIAPPIAHDASEHKIDARFEMGVAYYLPGVGSKPDRDAASAIPDLPNPFSGTQINRSIHFAGGRFHVAIEKLSRDYSVSLWIWNGFPNDARPITGYFFSRGTTDDQLGDHLGIGGTHRNSQGKIVFFNGKELGVGKSTLKMRSWNHIAMVRQGDDVRVFLNGSPNPEIDIQSSYTVLPTGNDLFVGGRCDGMFGFEGKIDEVALFDRVLKTSEVEQIFAVSGRPNGGAVVKVNNPANNVQPPLSSQSAMTPEESMKHLRLPTGFKAQLVAAEPNVLDPVAFDWDERGRLWVVEMADYPLGMDGEGKPGGRVRLLEDADRDGYYEKSSLFADGLSFPNGILTWRDGVIVTAAPELLFLRDDDDDGRADYREVLIAGLNEGNQQLRPNGLRWGLDNWVYVASGSPGLHRSAATPLHSTRHGSKLEVGTNDFRFRPDTGEMEIEAGPTQFGRSRDDWGHWFGTQNMRPLWHYVLPERYLQRNPYLITGDTMTQLLRIPAPVYPAHAPEKRFHNYGQSGHFTSACAGTIHRDPRLFGKSTMGFACEPFHNLVQQIEISEDGVTFSGRAITDSQHDFITSTDRWFRPVMVRTGPDGALWVSDMYRFMIEHPQFLPPEGKEELSKHYRQGDDKGRIYRIFRSDSELSQPIDLTKQTPVEWVAMLDSENGFIRDKVHQWLLWKNDPRALPELDRAARNPQRSLACLHALCILEGLNKLESQHLLAALQSPQAGLLENALRLAEPWLRSEASTELLDAVLRCTEDASRKVQFQTALTLGASKSKKASVALSHMLQQHYSDPLMLTGILTSASAHLNGLVETVVQVKHELRQYALKPLLQFALGSERRDAAARLLASVGGTVGESSTTKELELVIEAMSGVNTDLQTLNKISPKDSLAEQAWRLLGILDESLDFAKHSENPFERRMPAALLVSRIPQFQSEGLVLISTWLNASQPLPVQLAVIRALTQSGSDKVPAIFAEFWPTSGPAARNAVMEGWLSREDWCVDLLNRMKKKSIPLSALDTTHRSRLFNHQVGRVVNLAKQTLGNATSNRPEIIAKYQSALTLPSDSHAGHDVYKRICAACHRHGNEGIAIGPDMSAFVAHSPEKLLTNILDPNLDIQPGYQAFLCILHSGEQLYGVITQENSASLSIKGKEGIERTILRSEIEAMKATNVSFMPEGLESTIDAQQMADLLAFIKKAPTTSKKETTTPNR